MGMCRVAGSALSWRHTSWPDMPGIITSSRIRSGAGLPRAICRAFSPDPASFTRYWSLSRPESTHRLSEESSTASINGRRDSSDCSCIVILPKAQAPHGVTIFLL
ncbi:hypothetical protein D3C72_1889260 [compost metagenome]